MEHRKTAVVVVAAGRGERARRDDDVNPGPKQYKSMGAQSVIARTLAVFLNHPRIDCVVPVIHRDDEALYNAATHDLHDEKLQPFTVGGASRQASVFEGLKALISLKPDLVLVHDAVRPFVSTHTIDRVIDGLQKTVAVLPAMPIFDTIKWVEDTAEDDALPVTTQTVDRTKLWAAQTPQGFHFDDLFSAHEKTASSSFTDDCAVMENAGHQVHIVLGNADNFKITTPEDIDKAKRMSELSPAMETRVGNGFDVHAFEDGDAVILGGVSIPHSKKLKGHSDADVGLHTLTDAIYGALADGDIGSHFPPSDPQWKGAQSDQFLIHACERVRSRGGAISHLDLTIMCEAPKVGPYREQMRETIAKICNMPVSRVAVKATTTERLGFTGREEGIAAMATATIRLPIED